MRFWITRKSELSIHEQLVRQIVLAILSDDLPAGKKLPSIRAVARRYRIHNNTVSAAYQDLLARGWIESRPRSGMYVRSIDSSGDESADLDGLLAAFLKTARSRGYQMEEVMQRFARLVRPRLCTRILVAEPEEELRVILQTEIRQQLPVPVEALPWLDVPKAAELDRDVVVALTSLGREVRAELARGIPCISLRLRSVGVHWKDSFDRNEIP